jgi:hypothetical protein
MLIVRSLDGRAAVGLVCSCGPAHPQKLLDRGYPGTGRKYEDTINHDSVERVPLSE